jgi:hypothetical protein
MEAEPDLINERSREAHSVGTPDWAGLMPVGVAALGAPSRPVERLIGTQAAVYRLIVALGQLQLPRWKSRREVRSRAAASPHV